MSERLDKFIASRSTYSRRDVKDLLRQGKITLNAQPVRDPAVPICEGDVLCVNGTPFAVPKHMYLMLHKPKGVVSASASDNEKTVVDHVPPHWQRSGLFPAGRLDKDSTGFVLLTDDGDFAHRILSPKRHVNKTYRVTLRDPIAETDADAFAAGIVLGDGTRCLSATLEETDDPRVVRVILHEGRYHQVRRMFASLGNYVVELHRECIGALALDPSLLPGQCRPLTDAEVAKITQDAPADKKSF